MGVQTTFIIFCLLFGATMIYAGYVSKKWISDSSDFILAGREVSMGLNIMGVAAIGFAGTSVALSPGYAIMFGFTGSMYFGIIYSALGIIFYGVAFSNFIRRCGAQTLPEYLEMRYDSKVRNVVACGTIVGLCGILANNIVSLSGIVAGYVGWPIWATTSGCFLIIIIFAYLSGLWAVTVTDFIQMLIGVIAIPLFLILLVNKYGGLDFIVANWSGHNFWTQGMTGMSMPAFSFKYPSALTFCLLFGAALVWGNNYYWLRIASCRSERVAKSSYIWAGLLLIFLFFIPLAFVGLYAGAAMPEVFTLGGGKVAPVAAYGVMIKIFPPIISSFLLIGAVAASVSTAATATMGATSTATRDVYQRIINPKADQKTTLKASKVIMVLVGGLTWLLCFFPGGPNYLFAFANAWLVPPAVLLCLGMLWPKFNSNGAFWGVLVGIITMFILTLTDLIGVFTIAKWTHLGLVGFAVTLIVGIIASAASKPKYYGTPNWNYKAAEGNRENVKLNEFDIKVLDMIRYGHIYLADITDALQVDSRFSNDSIEKLDRGGYIEREGMKASNFYTFKITKKAKTVLPKLSEKEELMAEEGLTPQYLELLKVTAKAPEKLPQFAKDNNYSSLEVSSMVSHLVRQNLVLEKGFWKRELSITEKGKSAIEKFA